MKNKLIVLACLLLLCIPSVACALPYESYTYDYYGDVVPLPAPYAPALNVTGEALGIGALNQPADVFISDDGIIYLSDMGGGRVVILREDLTLVEVIEGYDLDGVRISFNKPQGLYLENGVLYLCDTGNGRIVALSRNDGGWQTAFVIERPDSQLLPDNFVFSPVKVAVDAAERVYVIGSNVLEGLMYFDSRQQFMGYFGTIKVQVSVADWFWRQFSTKEQRRKQSLFIPTEFTGFDIDGEGFIFTTEVDAQAEQTIKRINPAGRDVIKNYSHNALVGDLWYSNVIGVAGASEFRDIVAWPSGCYTAVDGKRGRIFTYDEEGMLLYVFAGLGTERGMLNRPTAVEEHNESIYVVDQGRNMLIRYDPTAFGRAVNAAIKAQHEGDDDGALAAWKQVLQLCAHYETAYAGLGKAYLNAGDNRMAMEYLERGNDKRYYSVALRRYRSEQVKRYFIPAVSALGALGAAAATVHILRARRKKHA